MNRIWSLIEHIIRFILCEILRFKLSDTALKKLSQFVKFGVVGLVNNLIFYVVYIILVSFSVHYLIASFIGFFVSVINAYYWNDKYVFRAEDRQAQEWWKGFLKTFLSYAGTGLVLNNILLVLWVDIIGMNEILGPILNLLITIPLNYILNKYWAFKI